MALGTDEGFDYIIWMLPDFLKEVMLTNLAEDEPILFSLILMPKLVLILKEAADAGVKVAIALGTMVVVFGAN